MSDSCDSTARVINRHDAGCGKSAARAQRGSQCEATGTWTGMNCCAGITGPGRLLHSYFELFALCDVSGSCPPRDQSLLAKGTVDRAARRQSPGREGPVATTLCAQLERTCGHE